MKNIKSESNVHDKKNPVKNNTIAFMECNSLYANSKMSQYS